MNSEMRQEVGAASGLSRQRVHHWSPGHNPGGAGLAKIHPAELQRRRKRCEKIVNKLRDDPRCFISACNICGSARAAILARPDRYGFPSRTVMCLDCGLIYLADRLTEASYSQFYETNCYRALSSLFRGSRLPTTADLHSDQARYARKLISAFQGYIDFAPGAKLLDIGGSAGKVALEFQTAFGMVATVLDPAAEEVAEARKLGLEGVTGTIEGWDTEETYDLVLFCRSIEHVQDLKGALEKIRRLMGPDGLLICDIVDFHTLCRAVGHPEAVTKIDHCYWLSQETAPSIFHSVGLEIVTVDVAFDRPLIGYLLRRCEPAKPAEADPVMIRSQIRSLLDTAAEWQESGQRARDLSDWVRRKGYRVKRKLINLLGLN